MAAMVMRTIRHIGHLEKEEVGGVVRIEATQQFCGNKKIHVHYPFLRVTKQNKRKESLTS